MDVQTALETADARKLNHISVDMVAKDPDTVLYVLDKTIEALKVLAAEVRRLQS